MSKRIRIPIRFKFMITFLVLVTAVVGLITFSTANLFREDKQAYINDLTSMVALATAEELQSLLNGSRERLQVYAGILVDSGLTAEEITGAATFKKKGLSAVVKAKAKAEGNPLGKAVEGMEEALESSGAAVRKTRRVGKIVPVEMLEAISENPISHQLRPRPARK